MRTHHSQFVHGVVFAVLLLTTQGCGKDAPTPPDPLPSNQEVIWIEDPNDPVLAIVRLDTGDRWEISGSRDEAGASNRVESALYFPEGALSPGVELRLDPQGNVADGIFPDGSHFSLDYDNGIDVSRMNYYDSESRTSLTHEFPGTTGTPKTTPSVRGLSELPVSSATTSGRRVRLMCPTGEPLLNRFVFVSGTFRSFDGEFERAVSFRRDPTDASVFWYHLPGPYRYLDQTGSPCVDPPAFIAFLKALPGPFKELFCAALSEIPAGGPAAARICMGLTMAQSFASKFEKLRDALAVCEDAKIALRQDESLQGSIELNIVTRWGDFVTTLDVELDNTSQETEIALNGIDAFDSISWGPTAVFSNIEPRIQASVRSYCHDPGALVVMVAYPSGLTPSSPLAVRDVDEFNSSSEAALLSPMVRSCTQYAVDFYIENELNPDALIERRFLRTSPAPNTHVWRFAFDVMGDAESSGFQLSPGLLRANFDTNESYSPGGLILSKTTYVHTGWENVVIASGGRPTVEASFACDECTISTRGYQTVRWINEDQNRVGDRFGGVVRYVVKNLVSESGEYEVALSFSPDPCDDKPGCGNVASGELCRFRLSAENLRILIN